MKQSTSFVIFLACLLHVAAGAASTYCKTDGSGECPSCEGAQNSQYDLCTCTAVDATESVSITAEGQIMVGGTAIDPSDIKACDESSSGSYYARVSIATTAVVAAANMAALTLF